MNTLSSSLQKNLQTLKKLLPSEDILTYEFQTQDNVSCALVYADGMVNKELLGALVAKPLSQLVLKKDGGRDKANEEKVQTTARFPELKTAETIEDILKEILDGNTLLLVDGIATGFIAGAKLLPVRAVIEPPTDIAVKGPREGFIEDVKTNMTLVRKRLKTPDLRFQTLRVGRRSDTAVVVCWLDGTSNEKIKDEIVQKIEAIDIDNVPDSSYISAFLSPRKHSVFRSVGTTEKPDIFAAKIAEGRVGILVDGSPIALTVPFLLTEDFQSSEDYFISPFMATIFRGIRFIALFVSIFLPAFYVSSQLFKMQLLPLGLMLTIASGVRELPLSPSMEMFVVLLLLEILKEASIRMPKYVGMSLSVVGALLLGDFAVGVGWVCEDVILYMAFVAIASFAQQNAELGYAFKFVRVLTLIFTHFLGVWGMLAGAALFIILVATNVTVTGRLHYLYPLVPLKPRMLCRIFFRERKKDFSDEQAS